MTKDEKTTVRRSRGFERTARLLQSRIREVGESRGFAVTRLLTHWEEIVGPAVATIARPVDVKYGRDGFGATLTILTTGAQAPMLEMQKEKLREKVNAVYGHTAIARVRITQTAPTGFSEGQVAFTRPAAPAPAKPDPARTAKARDIASDIGSDDLRAALEALGNNILARQGETSTRQSETK